MSDDKYCSQQIKVPPAYPDILKAYTKAAIRTQPRDLLRWSAAYFRALAIGDDPPAKQQLEMVQPNPANFGLSKGFLRAMHEQFRQQRVVKSAEICDVWLSLGQPKIRFDDLMMAGGFNERRVTWLEFLAIAAGTLCPDLTSTMRMVCEIISQDEAGAGAAVAYTIFESIYRYLARVDGTVPESRVNFVLEFLKTESRNTDDMVMIRHFEHPDCPNLQFP